jgi:hypothetical protein
MAAKNMLARLRLIEKVLDYEADDDEKREMVTYAGHKLRKGVKLEGEDVQFWAGEAIGEAVKEFGIEEVLKACAEAEHGSLGSIELALHQSGFGDGRRRAR